MHYAIQVGQLIDGTGGDPLEDMILIVSSGVIQQVQSADEAQLPKNLSVIDASAMTVMPGMVDAHVHVIGNGNPGRNAWRDSFVFDSTGTLALRSYANAMRHLRAGFTTIRDAGSKDYVDVAVRDAILNRDLVGPRMIVAGEAIASTGGHMDRTRELPHNSSTARLTNICDSPEEGRKAVRYQIKMGADFIKMSASLSEYVRDKGGLCSPEFSQETMEAICETAHFAGRKVGAHCHGGEGVTMALLAGVDCLEHGRFLSDEQLEIMAEKGVYLVPTLSPDARAMKHFRTTAREENKVYWLEKAYAAMFETVERAHQIGVKIGVGSDAAMPYVHHGQTAYEMELLVEAGLSSMDAIVSATRIGSEIANMTNHLGTIEAGKLADLVVLKGDPISDIRILQDVERIRMVIKDGIVVVDRNRIIPAPWFSWQY